MRTVVHILTVLAFVLASAQFTHAREVGHLDVHAHHANVGSEHGLSVGDELPEQEQALHCGVLVLLLVSELMPDSEANLDAFDGWQHYPRRTSQPSIDLPPPRT